MKSIIHWKSEVTGFKGESGPLPRDYAYIKCKEDNKTYPSIQHWVVDIDDYPESNYKKTKEQ